MKIADLENRITGGDCSFETLALFQAALKRVPKGSRCQHCYTTAAAMPPQLYEHALALIYYGLAEHCDCWLDRMRSYHNIAIILETRRDYTGAKTAYEHAHSSIPSDLHDNYAPEYASHLMRTEMHISNFEYTQELQRLYQISAQADPFSQRFQKTTFYRLLAQIILSAHQNDWAETKNAYFSATEMLRPGFSGPLTQLLKRKGFQESAGATREARAFLRRIKQKL